MAYTCTTCGASAETPGHLCSPCDETSSCNFCGKSKAEARHICRDKLVALQFFCTTCGRVAEKENFLCKPSPITE
jgi:hypothetical protein